MAVLGTPEHWDEMMAASQAARQDKADAKAEAYVIPEPEQRAVVMQVADTPRGARTLAKLAEKHGFAVTASYSRGPYIGDSAKVLRIVETNALWFHHPDGRQGMGCWVTPKGEGAWALDYCFTIRPDFRLVKSAALKAWLKGPDLDTEGAEQG